MESTGVYWKPVWKVPEEPFQMILANAQHIKLSQVARPIYEKDRQRLEKLLLQGPERLGYVDSTLLGRLGSRGRNTNSCKCQHYCYVIRNFQCAD
jgi:hypothetical protein